MSNGKHTPGPWFYNDGENGKYFPHVVVGGDDSNASDSIVVNSARGKNGGATMSEHQANAKLIAASPDLLEAAKIGLKWLSERENHAHWQDIDKIKSAIKKAEQ